MTKIHRMCHCRSVGAICGDQSFVVPPRRALLLPGLGHWDDWWAWDFGPGSFWSETYGSRSWRLGAFRSMSEVIPQ